MRHGARIEKLVHARRNVEPTRNTGLIARQRQRSYPFCNEVAGVRAMLPLDRRRFSPAWIMLEITESNAGSTLSSTTAQRTHQE